MIQDHIKQLEFAMSDLGAQDMFIGHEQLKLHNPLLIGEEQKYDLIDVHPKCRHTTYLRELESILMISRITSNRCQAQKGFCYSLVRSSL